MTMTIAPATPADGDSPFMTLAEASAFLRVVPQTMKNWRANGGTQGPPALKLGGLLRYNKDQLIEWALAQTEDR